MLNGDVPLIEAEDIDELVRVRNETCAPIAILTVDAEDPNGLGRVVRDLRDRVVGVVEEKDATDEQRELTEINVGIYAFDVAWLRRRLPDVPPSPVSGEIYLTHLIELARADELPVAALMLEDDGTLLGINDRVAAGRDGARYACPHQRATHARRRDDARPGLDPRGRDGRARRGRDARGRRDPLRNDSNRPRQRDPACLVPRQRHRSASAASCGRA